MRIKTIPKCILSVIVCFWSMVIMAQNLPEPQAMNNPPPPGLVVPIDMGIPGLIIGGLLIGFYFRKKD